jgi:Flp pilus assembly pilin Flp
MLWFYVHLSTLGRALVRPRRPDDRGQASAEYALVLLGAAAVALLVVGWATQSNKVGKLLDAVLGKLMDHIT